MAIANGVGFYDDCVVSGGRRIPFSLAYPANCTSVISLQDLFFCDNAAASAQFIRGMYDFIVALDSSKQLTRHLPRVDDYVATRVAAFQKKSWSFCRGDAVTVENRPPLILYSPGWGLPRWGNFQQISELVNAGFAVAVVDHPRTGFPNTIVYPGGEVESVPSMSVEEIFKTIDQKMLETRVADLAAVYSKLRGDEKLASKIDCDKLGLFGYSIGGASAALALHKIPQAQAAVNIDGSMLYNELKYVAAAQPLKLIYSSPFDADLQREIAALKKIFPASSAIGLAPIQHLEFLSLTLSDPADAPVVPTTFEPTTIQRQLSVQLIEFFNETLRPERQSFA